MAIWPFGRKKSKKPTKDVPEEVQEYYQSERRERVGIAWLLALATLLTTIVLAVGIYFGGRWAWRETFGDKDEVATTEPETQQPQNAGNDQNQGNDQADQPAQNQPQNPPAQQPHPSQPSTPRQNSNQAPNNLSQTGPADTVAIFIGASALGALGYQVYMRRKLIN
jgi:hypothetical protein